MKDIAVVVTTYNRPGILKKSLESLSRVLEKYRDRFAIYLFDDASDLGTRGILASYSDLFDFVQTNSRNLGSRLNCMQALRHVSNQTYHFIYKTDSDVIYSSQFAKQLIQLTRDYTYHPMSLFNSDSPMHIVMGRHHNYLLKDPVGGISMLWSKRDLQRFVKYYKSQYPNADYAWDVANTDLFDGAHVTKQSFVQHIGNISSTGRNHRFDQAIDFIE